MYSRALRGLESHPQHELASRQMENGMYGGMISFELRTTSRA